MENQINFIQIEKDNEEHFEMASKLWVPFIREVHEHDGTDEDEEQIINGLTKRIAIQGSRKDMHFEMAIVNGEPFGIAMFAIDLGTILSRHIETVLRDDGAENMYICPDAVTGEPFWKANGYKDSGKIDPDDKKPIYIKKI